MPMTVYDPNFPIIHPLVDASRWYFSWHECVLYQFWMMYMCFQPKLYNVERCNKIIVDWIYIFPTSLEKRTGKISQICVHG